MKNLPKISILVTLLLLILLVPNSAFAKKNFPKGYERDRGKEIIVAEPLGWPVKVKTSSYMSGSVESLPEMTVIRLVPYNPWWRFWGKTPETTEFVISGLPTDTDLHIYIKGYREHQVLRTDNLGRLFISLESKPGNQIIIKSKPSTYKISIGGLLFKRGGDCEDIGTWNKDTKTCTLNSGSIINDSIVIEDPEITLDGNNATISEVSGDGIYTDLSDVKIKNITVKDSSRGIVFADSFLSVSPSGGIIENVQVTNNSSQIIIDDMSDFFITGVTVSGGTTGIRLTDINDLISDTDNINISNSSIDAGNIGIYFEGIQGAFIQKTTIKNNPLGVAGIIDGTVIMTKNNFLDNYGDVDIYSGNLILSNPTSRGNFWNKNTGCEQKESNPNHCADKYDFSNGTDNLPWACENGWITPCSPLPPDGGGGGGNGGGGTGSWAEISSTTGTANLYESADTNSTKLKILPSAWVVKILDKTGTTFWKVEDVTDSTIGYVEKSLLNPTNDSVIIQHALRNLDDVDMRKLEILKIIDHYYNDTSSTQGLYSSTDKNRDGVNNNISSLKNAKFPIEVLIAMLIEESFGTFGSDLNGKSVFTEYNNELRTYDFGYGLYQMTKPSNLKGKTTGYFTKDEKCEFFRYVSVDGIRKENHLCKFYTNTHQGIALDIKDGYGLLVEKLNRSLLANANSADLIKLAGSVWRYNGNFPNSPGDYKTDYLSRVGLRISQLKKEFGTDYQDKMRVSNDNGLFVSSGTLEEIRKKFINHTTGEIKSPAELFVKNSQGNITGLKDGTINRNIPESDYEAERFILYDNSQFYTYFTKGLSEGVYGLTLTRFNDGNPTIFNATGIPTKSCALHEYAIAWDVLSAGGQGVTVKVDQDCDGIFESTFKSDSELTQEEFVAQTDGKITICHIPPGNLENAHTITIGESALKAHILHGDYEGPCGNEGVSIKAKIKNE